MFTRRFPCHDVGELKCSPAFDWHLSTLIERGLINGYGTPLRSILLARDKTPTILPEIGRLAPKTLFMT